MDKKDVPKLFKFVLVFTLPSNVVEIYLGPIAKKRKIFLGEQDGREFAWR